MPEPTNADIMQAIGRLQGNMEGVSQRLDQADTNRGAMYAKIEETGRSVTEVSFSVRVAADVATQAREEVKSSKLEFTSALNALKADIAPVIEQWKAANTIGKVLIALLTAGGISVTVFVIWAGDIVTSAVRHWLGIGQP